MEVNPLGVAPPASESITRQLVRNNALFRNHELAKRQLLGGWVIALLVGLFMGLSAFLLTLVGIPEDIALSLTLMVAFPLLIIAHLRLQQHLPRQAPMEASVSSLSATELTFDLGPSRVAGDELTDHNTDLALDKLGVLLTEQGDYAVSRPTRTLAIVEEVLGPRHPDTASTLNNLGVLLYRQGEYAAARHYYERALAIVEEVLGPRHPDTASTLNNLGVLLYRQGEYAAARRYYERALAIVEEGLGSRHLDTARTLNNLGMLLVKQGDYAAAFPYLERALAISEMVLGPNHPDTALRLNNLSTLLDSQGEYAAVLPYLERALAIRAASQGATRGQDDSGKSINYLEEDDRVRESEGVLGYFVWSEDIWKSIQDGYIKQFDLDFYYQLDLPIARRLYRFLDKRMAYQSEYEIDIYDLTNRLSMARYDYPSHALRKLQPALDELRANGFLASAEAVKVGKYTRLRFRRHLPPSAQRAPTSQMDPNNDEVEVQEALVKLGFASGIAAQLLERYGPEHVREKLAYLRWELEVHVKALRSPRGWLRKAIEEDYGAPAGYDPDYWSEEGANEEVSEESAAPTPHASREQELWGVVLRDLKSQVPPSTFQVFLSQTRLLKAEQGVAVIGVPSPEVQAWLEYRFSHLLARSLAYHLGYEVQMVFVLLQG